MEKCFHEGENENLTDAPPSRSDSPTVMRCDSVKGFDFSIIWSMSGLRAEKKVKVSTVIPFYVPVYCPVRITKSTENGEIL